MIALLSAVVLSAATVAPPPTLSAPALCSPASASIELAETKGGGISLDSTCTADCGPYTDVSCSGTTCNAVNRSCPGERGHVTCGSSTYYCPVCDPPCTEGTYKTVVVGPTCGCEDGTSTPKERYQCIGGVWEFLYSFCGGPFCPDYP